MVRAAEATVSLQFDWLQQVATSSCLTALNQSIGRLRGNGYKLRLTLAAAQAVGTVNNVKHFLAGAMSAVMSKSATGKLRLITAQISPVCAMVTH